MRSGRKCSTEDLGHPCFTCIRPFSRGRENKYFRSNRRLTRKIGKVVLNGGPYLFPGGVMAYVRGGVLPCRVWRRSSAGGRREVGNFLRHRGDGQYTDRRILLIGGELRLRGSD